jgi:hypothetical protein
MSHGGWKEGLCRFEVTLFIDNEDALGEMREKGCCEGSEISFASVVGH